MFLMTIRSVRSCDSFGKEMPYVIDGIYKGKKGTMGREFRSVQKGSNANRERKSN